MGLKTARSKLNLLVFLAASFWAWGCGQAIESDIFVPIRLDCIPQGITVIKIEPSQLMLRLIKEEKKKEGSFF